MRLSADVISRCEQRSNALGEREIVLRGLAIPAIEHLAATRDMFDAVDMSSNDLSRLENLPRLGRLTSLYLGGNAIEGVDGSNLKKNAPALRSLVLTDNRIQRLSEVKKLGESCPNLEHLVLRGNPVSRRQHYRLYAINRIPSLRVLDFAKVNESERDRARRLASSAAGAALEGDARAEAREAAGADMAAASSSGGGGVKTFEPGEGIGGGARESLASNFTAGQREEIRRMVEGAVSPQEIERIESFVRRGVFPGTGGGTSSTSSSGGGGGGGGGGTIPSPPPLTEDGENRKRAAAGGVAAGGEGDGEGPAPKKGRVS